MQTLTDVWPLFRLSITTERLELRVPCDDDIKALVSVARAGIHDPDQMPFENAWTDRPDDEFDLGFAQYFWAQRARWSADSWELPFAVFLDGEPIGVQQLTAEAFPIARTIGTGSWLAREVQGRGFGAEMRSAVLDLGFFGLVAEQPVEPRLAEARLHRERRAPRHRARPARRRSSTGSTVQTGRPSTTRSRASTGSRTAATCSPASPKQPSASSTPSSSTCGRGVASQVSASRR